MSQKPNYSSSSDDEEQQQTSGSEDEQSSGSDSGSDTDSDLPPKKPINKPKETKPPPPPPPRVLAVVEKESNKIKQNNVTKPKPRASSSSESDSEESYTETDTESDKSKPSGLRKLVETKSVEKTGSKPVQVNNKRAVNDSGVVEKEAKKIKQNKIDSESESDSDSSRKKIVKVKAMELKSTGGKDVRVKSEKQLFQRLWSEDDEIVVLEGMIGYENKNGENAIADMGAFHEFIKRKLHVDVSRAQLVDKVRRLKKKYVNNASREKDGKDRTFSNSHQQKGYELSKLIWGSNSNSNSKSKKKNQVQKSGVTSLVTSNGVEDKDKVMMEVEKNVDISRFVRYGGMSGSPIVSEEIVKGGLELVEGSKRAELEGKWRKLKEQELEIYVKRMELLREQALVILDAVRSSGN